MRPPDKPRASVGLHKPRRGPAPKSTDWQMFWLQPNEAFFSLDLTLFTSFCSPALKIWLHCNRVAERRQQMPSVSDHLIHIAPKNRCLVRVHTINRKRLQPPPQYSATCFVWMQIWVQIKSNLFFYYSIKRKHTAGDGADYTSKPSS